MSNVRELGRKIHSLKNMQKVTRAMNMISSIKLRKYLSVQDASDMFYSETERICRRIREALSEYTHPVTTGYPEVRREHLIMLTSDKGLCGTHNNSIIRRADSFISEQLQDNIESEFTCIGQKGIHHAEREEWTIISRSDMHERLLTSGTVESLGEKIYSRFLSGEIQRVRILGHLFRSTIQQDVELQQLLPLPPVQETEAKENVGELQTEPGGEQLASEYGNIYLIDKIRSFLNQSLLSEHAARLTAMENATNNSEDLIDKYSTMQNRARQAGITNELIEIVSGKEALKG